MHLHKKFHPDHLFFLLLLLLIVGIPWGIKAYDHSLEPQDLPSATKSFTLVGNAHKGWQLGEAQAFSLHALWNKSGQRNEPVIRVDRDDLVVLKLKSSDVTHGFSLKAFGVYLTDGILPGKTAYVSFKADKAGTFVFACNVFCGDIHQHMRGKLIVK